MRPNRNEMLSFEDGERIRTALSAAAVAEEAETPARVEAALLLGLRRRNQRGMALRLAAAAAVVATVWAGLLALRPGAPAPDPERGTVAVRTEVPREAVVVSAPPMVVVVERPAKVAVRRSPRKAARPEEKRVDRMEFIPVGVWQAYEPMERGSIVRVRLPKSSLPIYGIPVSADRWNESIPADVVLGEDGSMRAIRFVSPVQ